ncbi:hypothetical protein Scep_000381 [Stephania cephalantha]|uniref:Uncharacterized protein n=1 Tax=Stephania cephalantha TaxID=152367 RepID=A0AAP0Q2V9_9MAGN
MAVEEKKKFKKKKKKNEEEKGPVSKKKKKERKAYDLPGQKRDPPEERDPLRIFYESLYDQSPGCEMAQFCNRTLVQSSKLDPEDALFSNNASVFYQYSAYATPYTIMLAVSQLKMMESGLLPLEVAKKVYEKKQKKSRLNSPIKTIKSVAVEKNTSTPSKSETLESKTALKQSKKRKLAAEDR